MKVFDQMQGVKTAAGDPIMHIGLFFGILFVPIDQSCSGMTYSVCMKLLIISHFVNASRFLISVIMVQMVPLFPSLGFVLYFLERIFDFVGVIMQLFATIFAQDVFFFTARQYGSNDCTKEGFGVTRSWLNLEVFVFYSTFVANFIFILLSEFLLKKTGLMYLEKKEKQTDFLLKYKTMNGLYQTFSMMLSCTFYVIYRASEETKEKYQPTKDNEVAVYFMLGVMAFTHLMQLISVNLQLFSSRESRNRNEKVLANMQIAFIIVLPLITVIYQIIWLILMTQEHFNQIYFRWIICDVFLNSCGSIAYLIQLERIAFE